MPRPDQITSPGGQVGPMPEFLHIGLRFDEPGEVRELLARLRADGVRRCSRSMKTIQFDDEIEIRVGVEKTGGSAVRFGWQILRGDEPCVEGTVIHVGTGGRGAPWLEGLRSGRPSTA